MRNPILCESLLASAMLLAACSKHTIDPTIDATTQESLKASSAKVRESLQEGRRSEFDASLQTLILIHLAHVDTRIRLRSGAVAPGQVTVEDAMAQLRATVNGKSADEVIGTMKRMHEEGLRLAQERKQAEAEMAELLAKKGRAETAKGWLGMFEVVRASFRKEHRDYLRDQPVIELTVRNRTGRPISRAHFAGTLTSPGRTVPWLKDDFDYSIPGVVEPGEEKTWSLTPNRFFSGWGRVEAPADAVLTVTVEQLDGADGMALYSARDFSDDDATRLEKLMSLYGLKRM